MVLNGASGTPDRFEIIKHIWNRGHDIFLKNDVHEKDIPALLGLDRSDQPLAYERIMKRFSNCLALTGSRFPAFVEFLNGNPEELRKWVVGDGTKLIPSVPNLKRFEAALGLDGLFDAVDLAAVTYHLESCYDRSARYWQFSKTDESSSNRLTLSPGENKVFEMMRNRLLADMPQKLAFAVRQSSLQGATTCALALCRDDEVLNSYDSVHLIQPSSGDILGSGSERELLLVMENLGLKPADIRRNARADALISALCEKNALLIMLSHKTSSQGLCRTLVSRLRKNPTILSAVADQKRRVLVLCEDQDLQGDAIDTKDVTGRNLFAKKTTKENAPETIAAREALFFECLESYGVLKRKASRKRLRLSDTTGYRINWCRRFLQSDVAKNITPMETRLLALFCTNRENFSFFDPTLGWSRLVGRLAEPLPLELDLYHRELELYFDRYVPRTALDKKDTVERSLWVLATAVFWLRGSVLEEVMQSNTSFGGLAPTTTLDLKQLIQHLRHVSADVELPNDEAGLRVPMGLKAVAQDRWLQRGNLFAEARRRIHGDIAESLFQRRNDPGYVAQEFPFEADSLGSDRLYFRAEILRHKVRSYLPPDETAPESVLEASDTATEILPDPTALGSLENAYFGMFRVEMNGNGVEQKQRFSPGLAHQYGAYRLSAELHQLMEPWARNVLTPKSRLRFLRHLAYSCIDIGDLGGAADVFAETARIAGSLGPYEECSVLLDRLLLFTETESAAHIGAQIRTAEIAYAETLKLDMRDVVAQRLRHHMKTRKASYFLFNNDFIGALNVLGYRNLPPQEEDTEAAHYQKLNFLSRLSGRAGHIFVDACIGAAETSGHERQALLNDALNVCLINEARERHGGRPHSSLGFVVHKASVFRVSGQSEVAEVTLDTAYSTMLQTGGSIRTYLSLLEEAGRTLVSLGQPEKAFYLYLKRHLTLCRQLGFRNREDRTIGIARAALEASAGRNISSEATWRARMDAVVASSKVLREEFERETDETKFHAPYSGYWHPTGARRYDEPDLYRLPNEELEAFEEIYGKDPVKL